MRLLPLLVIGTMFSLESCSAAVERWSTAPDDKIDVGVAALTLAKEIYPNVDVSSYSARIDALADEVSRLAHGSADPDHRIRCLNTVLFLYEKFQAERDVSFQRKQENYFLNRLLDTKRGNCYSIPLLYVAVAQRLGWPVYLVHVPDHSFVRYVDPSFHEQNIEATSGGGFVPDQRYARDFRVNERAKMSGAYLRTLTYREVLGDLIAINGITFGRRGDVPKAMRYLAVATKLNTRFVDAWANLANANRIMAARSGGNDRRKYAAAAAACAKRTAELGFVNPTSVPQLASARRPQ